MKQHVIYLGVIAVLIIVIGFNRCSNEDTTTVKTETTTKIDSTVVDSLTNRIEYLESIPPDTITVRPEVDSVEETEDTTETGEQINRVTSSYSDSLITARWTLLIAGELVDQEFTYIPRATPVIRETRTEYRTQYMTTTNTTTITKQTGGFLSVGGSVGTSTIGFPYELTVRYQAKDGYSYHGRYLKMPTGDEAYMLGITIPIRIKIPFL